MTAKHRVVKFQEMNLRKGQMAVEGMTSRKECLRRKCETPWQMSATGPGSEPEDGEELGDDDDDDDDDDDAPVW